MLNVFLAIILNKFNKKFFLSIVFVAALFLRGVPFSFVDNIFTPKVVQADTWWDANWSKRVKITFTNDSRGALVNFPALVSLGSGRVSYADFKAGGSDIRFVDADGTTVLNYEIEKWDTSSTSTIWVKIPQIDSASNVDYVYMYYGNSGASATATTTGVWDSNYTTVQHWAEDPTGPSPQFQDSTANNKDGIASATSGAVVATALNGKFGNGLDFNGTTQYVDQGDGPLGSLPDGSVEFWFDIDSMAVSTGNRYLHSRVKSGANNGEMRIYIDTTSASANQNKVVYQIECTAPTLSTTTVSTSNVVTDTWYHVVAVWDNNTTGAMRLYVNGSQVGVANTTTCGSEATAVNTNEGRNNALFNGYLDGQMDELRVSTIARSADWINASYVSGTDGLNTYASAEVFSDTVAPIISSIATSSITATTATISWTTDKAATSTINYGLTASYGSASSSVVATTTHSIVLINLATSTTYHFQISTWDSSSNLATSTDYVFTTAPGDAPGQPTSLIATPYENRIYIRWTASTGSLTDYLVEYKPSSEPTAWTTFSDGVSVATSTTITGLSNGTSYNVRVTGLNGAATGTPSTFATATPGYLMTFINPTISNGGSTTTTSITAYASTTTSVPSLFTFRLETSGGSLVSEAATTTRYGDYSLGHLTELSHRTNLALTVTDLSGQVYVPTTNTLFTVHNNQNKITEVTPEGVTVRTITCSSCGDIEDITLVSSVASTTAGGYDHTFMISTEDVDIANLQIFRVVIHSTGAVTVNRNDYYSTGIAAAATNDGLEGIAYNSNTGTYFVSVEGQATQSTQPRIYEVTLGSGHSASAVQVCSNLNFRNYLTEDNTVAYGNTTYADISGLDYVPSVDRLYVISHKSDKIIEIDVSNRSSCSTPLNSLPIAMRADSGANHDFEMPEGVAWDGTGDYMYVSAESDYWSIWRTNTYSVRNTFSGLSYGSYNLFTSVTDMYGNTSTTTARSFTVTAPGDTTTPIITLSSTSTATSTATILWNTDEAASSSLRYGLTTSYGSVSATSSGTSTHSASLTGLTPNTTYHVQILAIDTSGNSATSSDYTFITSALPDTTAPTIGNGTTTNTVGPTSAMFSWSTSEAASSSVLYGLTSSYGLVASSSGTTSHSVSISSLSEATTYHYKIVAIDAAGNASSTIDNTFTTTDATAPSISSIASSTATSTATVTWVTNEAASSSISYGLTTSYGTVASSSATSTHSVSLTSLTPNTLYHYRVFAQDSSGNISTSTDKTFTTTVFVDTVPPGISTPNVTLNSSTSVAIAWNTDELASTFVQYGPGPEFGSTTSEIDTSPRVLVHSVTLSNLRACGLYYYQVRSIDASSNSATSSIGTFNTSGCAGAATVIEQSAENVSTSTGGVVDLLNGGKGVEITVPTNFSTTSLTFQIKKVSETETVSTTGLPDGGLEVVSDHLYDFKAFSDTSTVVSTFNTPLTVTFTYTAADITGMYENTLVLKRWDGTWHDLAGCVVNTGNKTITCTTTGFSVFGLFGTPIPAPVVVSSGGSGSYSSGGSTGGSWSSAYAAPIIGSTSTIATTSVTNVTKVYISKSLKKGMVDAEVLWLQKALNLEVSTRVATPGNFGSKGKETNKFAGATDSALRRFQLYYKIVPNSRTTGYGVVGPATRGKANQLLNAAVKAGVLK